MFERRLGLLLFILGIPTLVLVLRLGQLQLVSATEAEQETEALLYRPPQYFPCLRVSITDRFGTPLAYDAPSWDVEVHYGVLADDEYAYIDPLARRDFPETALDEARDEFGKRIEIA